MFSKRIMKKSVICMCILLLFLVMPVHKKVLAADSTQGSLTIYLEDIDTPMNSVSFLVYKIAVVDETGKEYWKLDDELTDSGVNVNEISTAEESLKAAKKLADIIPESSIEPDTLVTDINGKGFLDKLSTGLYLVVQEEPEMSDYGLVAPFFADIPQRTDDGIDYDAVVYPKGQRKDVIPEVPEEPSTPDKPNQVVQTGDMIQWETGLLLFAISGIMSVSLLYKTRKESE